MKMRKSNILLTGIFTAIILVPSCNNAGAGDSLTDLLLFSSPGISLMKGEEIFVAETVKLLDPQGVIPAGLATRHAPVFDNYPSLLRRDPADYYEYFVFDRDYSLIVISVAPFYFLKLESRAFHFHLSGELDQLRDGLSGTAKSINTVPVYNDIGDYSVEIYFTPKEMKFSSSGTNKYRIIDNNGNTYVDVWRLYSSALITTMYFPVYEDEKIHEDIKDAASGGRIYRVFTNQVTIADPENYTITTSDLNFSFMAGRELLATDDLIGSEDIRFVDTEELTRDFIVYFSLPIGNSMGTNNYMSTRDGIVVVVRGHELKRLKLQLAAEGIPVL